MKSKDARRALPSRKPACPVSGLTEERIRTLYDGRGRPDRSDEGSILRKEREDATNTFFVNFLLFRPLNLFLCPARSAKHRLHAEKELASMMQLPQAVASGLIDGYRVLWGSSRRYPQYAQDIWLFLPEGRDEWRKRLGNYLLSGIRLTACNALRDVENLQGG